MLKLGTCKAGDDLLGCLLNSFRSFSKEMRKLLIMGFLSLIKRVKTVVSLQENKWNKCSPKKKAETLAQTQSVQTWSSQSCIQITTGISVQEQAACFVASEAETLYSPFLQGCSSSPRCYEQEQGGVILTVEFMG